MISQIIITPSDIMTEVSQAKVNQREESVDRYSLSHTKWNCIYHIVFIPKYRRKVLFGQVRQDIREILRKLCEYKSVEIVEGSVSVDYVHLCLKIPPKTSVSEFMGYLNRKI